MAQHGKGHITLQRLLGVLRVFDMLHASTANLFASYFDRLSDTDCIEHDVAGTNAELRALIHITELWLMQASTLEAPLGQRI
jgi:hypothetical protein